MNRSEKHNRERARVISGRSARRATRIWVATGVVLGTGLGGAWMYRQHSASIREVSAAGLYCDSGIGAVKATGRSTMTAVESPGGAAAPVPANWIPKINDARPSGSTPEGMTWIPGGEFWMGSREDRMTDAKPWHRVYVDGYWMDKTEVTNEQFARFVKATGYVTVAERKPRAEDYPQALPEELRDPFVTEVMDRMGEPLVLDYVRLNIDARVTAE